MIIAIDTETYKYNQIKDEYEPILDAREFIIGCIKTEDGRTKFFKEAEEMWKWIDGEIEKNKKKGRLTYIYGHNTEYDYYAIGRKHLLEEETKHIIFRPFLAIRKEKGYYCDTMSFYKTSLAEVGEMLGIEKKEMPITIREIDELKEYLERDVEITLKAIIHLKKQLEELGYKPRKLMTAGQVAMTCFLTYCKRKGTIKRFTTYNKEKRRREVIKTKYPRIIREAYRGGDNQATRTGYYKNTTLIDKNGMYADMMRKMDFPDLRSETLTKKPTKEMFKRYMEKQVGIARIKVKSPNTIQPVLPIRYGDYQIFPSNTKMRGTWTFIEIEQAIKEGYEIEEIEWCIRYNKQRNKRGEQVNPLKDFIEELYKIEKKKKTKADKIALKLIRNNLSGKFAQNRKNKEMKIVRREESAKYAEEGYKTRSSYEDKYIMIKETDNYDPAYTAPIISIYTTAMARLELHKEEMKIPYEDRLYKDTDSLIYRDETGETTKRFKIGKELGEWKIERDDDGTLLQNKPCKILGEKRYYIGNKVSISGISKRERNKEIIEKEENVKTRRIYGLGSAYERGEWEKVGAIEEIEIEMKIHSKNEIITPEYIDECKIEIEEKNGG